MTIHISRRDFIKLGTICGISIMIGRLPNAHAVEVGSASNVTDWLAPDGKVRYSYTSLNPAKHVANTLAALEAWHTAEARAEPQPVTP